VTDISCLLLLCEYIPTNVFLSLSSLSVTDSFTKYAQIMCYCCLTDLDMEPEKLAEPKTQ